MTEQIRNQMREEMADKSLFEQARGYAYHYADEALERQVFPTEVAIQALSEFEEPLPEQSSAGTVFKAIALLGFGIDNIEWVDASLFPTRFKNPGNSVRVII